MDSQRLEVDLHRLELRFAVEARALAAPSFISISSRGTSIAASSRSRFQSHLRCASRVPY